MNNIFFPGVELSFSPTPDAFFENAYVLAMEEQESVLDDLLRGLDESENINGM